MVEMYTNRLFVPLAKEPFEDFRDRGKEVEVRKNARQYTAKTVVKDRLVELRLGYSGKESIWGEVGRIVVGSWEDVFEIFDLLQVEPRFQSIEEAIRDIEALFGETGNLIAFEVKDKRLVKNVFDK